MVRKCLRRSLQAAEEAWGRMLRSANDAKWIPSPVPPSQHSTLTSKTFTAGLLKRFCPTSVMAVSSSAPLPSST